MIAFTAAITISSGSFAFAYEAPENKIGDRYPNLEQRYSYERTGAIRGASMPRQYAGQYNGEVPENRLGDRYAFLEQSVQPAASGRFAGPYLTQRQARMSTASYQYTNETPENKIGDRYPLLEQTYATRASSRVTTAGRS